MFIKKTKFTSINCLFFFLDVDGNDELVDFETAISATGFGKFNIILFFIALPSTWSSEFDFTSTSYILPAAQCDLDLSLVDKGMLNAITYLGKFLLINLSKLPIVMSVRLS